MASTSLSHHCTDTDEPKAPADAPARLSSLSQRQKPPKILTEVAVGPMVARATGAVASDRVTFLILSRALAHSLTVLPIRARWTSFGKKKCKPIN